MQTTTSAGGARTPEILVTLPPEWPYRRLKAVLYGLAMDVELTVPQGVQWISEVQVLEERRGRIYLELGSSDDAEVLRAAALLRDVLQRQLDLLEDG